MRVLVLTIAIAGVLAGSAGARPVFDAGAVRQIDRSQDENPALDAVVGGRGRFAILWRRSTVPPDNPFPPTVVDTTLFLQTFDRRVKPQMRIAAVHPTDTNVGNALAAISRSGRVIAVLWVEYTRDSPGIAVRLQTFSARDGRKLSPARVIRRTDGLTEVRLAALEPRRGGFWAVTSGGANEVRAVADSGRPVGRPISYRSGDGAALAAAARDGRRLLVLSRPLGTGPARWAIRVVTRDGRTAARRSSGTTGDYVNDVASVPGGGWTTLWTDNFSKPLGYVGTASLRRVSSAGRLGSGVVVFRGTPGPSTVAYEEKDRGTLAWTAGSRPCPSTLHMLAVDRAGHPASAVETPLAGRARSCDIQNMALGAGDDRFLFGWSHIGYVPNSPKYDYRILAAPLRFRR